MSHVRTRSQEGLALLAVLVVLGILMALVAPFLLSMTHAANSVEHHLDRTQTDLAVASGRDAVLFRAARYQKSVDDTPSADGLSETRIRFSAPDAYASLADGKTHLLTSESEDEQQRANLRSMTPLLLGNLLDLATFTAAKVSKDQKEIMVQDPSGFPETGYVVIDGELMHYGGKQGSNLTNVERGLLNWDTNPESPFAPAHDIDTDMLVVDMRVRLAVTWPFDEGGNGRRAITPWRTVDELSRIGELPFGPFTREMIDRLRPHVTTWSTRLGAAEWIKPERIFTELTAGLTRELIVRTGEFLGPGTVVRITGEGQEEFALVRRCEPAPAADRGVTLSAKWKVTLERPILFSYRETHAFLQAMAPHPVNANTASVELLTAMLRGIQQRPGMQRGDGHPVTITPLPRMQAEELARSLVTLRDTPDSQGHKLLLSSWEDLVERWIKPQLTSDMLRGNQLVNVYRNLLNSRDAGPAMGTAPLCFVSDTVARFRSAAATLSGVGLERARREVQGFAWVIPGGELLKTLTSQDQFEEELRLNRESPWWTSGPNNTGSTPGGSGSNPANRYLAHLLPTLHGLPARFPTRDPAESFVQARPANQRLSPLQGSEYQYQDFFDSPHSDGRELDKEGAYQVTETGKGRAGGGAGGGGGQRRGQGSQGSFGFAGATGLMRPFATMLWWRLRDQSEQTLFDLADSEDTRNRVALQIKEGKLQYVAYDAAGQDPDYPDVPTAGIFEIPLTDLRVQADQWLHVNMHADGTRPDQMALLTDGALKGKARYRTYLTQQIATYRPSSDRFTDRGRYPTIAVESTDGFPDQGVLRIGTELFEYTSKAGNTFVCERVDSLGRRAARMAMVEFNQARMSGLTGFDEEQLNALDEAPSHAAGSAVELYGYSSPFLANTVVPNGAARLPSPLGPWGVARVVNGNKPIGLLGPPPLTLGVGIDETVTEIELAAPVIAQGGGSNQGNDHMRPFLPTGGLAVLIQQYFDRTYNPPGRPGGGEQIRVGGLEVVRYSRVQGNKLTGLTRGLTLPPDLSANSLPYFSGQAQKFVTDWQVAIWDEVNQILIRDPENYIQLCVFVVPISIPAVGNVVDPTTSGYAEWAQIYPGKDNEADTEWVRYDAIVDRQVVRSRVAAMRALFRSLLGEDRLPARNFTGQFPVGGLTLNYQYPQPPRYPYKEIGYPDDFETGGSSATANLPHYAARRAFRFRGDPSTATSSHAQTAAAQMMPTIRMELRRQQYPAAISPRLGRNDRIAFLAGDDALSSVPPEWHTANWSYRKWNDDSDARDQAGNPLPAAGRDLTGPHCQLIALKAGLVLPGLLGRGTNQNVVDIRQVDRVLKFPSGELPAKVGTAAWVGGRKGSKIPPARGFVDELSILSRILPHSQSTEPTSWYLSGTMAEGSDTLVLSEYGLRGPNGLRAKNGGGRVAPILKQGGGLLLCDGELMAYDSVEENGTVHIAQNGHGLLGTIRRAHDEGAAVSFVDEVPTTTLTGGMSASGPSAAVQSVAGFPVAEGTFLCDQELVHFTWSRVSPDGPGLLEMPEFRRDTRQPPNQTSTRDSSGGLFRGRFGTTPAGHASGVPILWFPIRFWDRYAEFADDPELAYFGSTLQGPDLFVQGLYWEDETFDATCKPLALLRMDQLSPWSGVPVDITEKGELKPPDAVPGLFRFKQGKIEDKPNKLALQGNQFEVRIFHVYQGGAFDPVLFNAPGWKTAPRVRNLAIPYQGETRILEQKETAR